MMRGKAVLAIGMCFFLAGCGTLRISINYGVTPTIPSTEIQQDFTQTMNAIPTWTPTPTVTPSPMPTTIYSESTIPNPTESISPAVAVAAGNSHTCALLASGRVKCWGDNENGQLGNGSMVNSAVPVDVAGLTDAMAITAGWRHTCVLTSGGGVKCWGYNRNGELGNGTTVDSSSPTDAKNLASGVVAIDSGDDHTCAVTTSGGMKCWGYNDYGQLGDGTKANRSVPVTSVGFSGGLVSVAAGGDHTCALTAGGGAKCWGDNEYGQLGNAQTADVRLTPVDVIGLTYGVLKISSDGSQSCALTTGGGVSCWGNNKYGQLGDGSGQTRDVPVQVTGLTAGVSDVEVGWNHTCAVVEGGQLECWGWNYYGQLGDGTKITKSNPTQVYHLTDGIQAVAAGWAHTCVATDLGAVKCWGRNNYGQLGDGTKSNSGIPLAVVGMGSVPEVTKTFTPIPIVTTPTATNSLSPTPWPTGTGSLAIAASSYDTCALTGNNIVKCWGENTSGQLGNGSTVNSASPVVVGGLSGHIIAIATSGMHACALTAEGRLKCWGNNNGQELGDGTADDRTAPVDVTIFTGIARSMALGMEHTCVLTDSGGVKCWGNNEYGQLGDGTHANGYAPVDVIGLTSGVTAISAGMLSSCAVTENGAVKCWGYNLDGQLGDGTTTFSNVPVEVAGLSSSIVGISMGVNHSCALTVYGGIKCWGKNQNGQLGNGTTTDSFTPVDVSEPANDFIDIKAGNNVTCALTKVGGVKCWGYSLDIIQTPASKECFPYPSCSKPVDITGLSRGVTTLAMGWYHVCIITSVGQVMCWGNNGGGQLGDGTREDRPPPGVVIGL